MAYALELFFDAETESAVRAIWGNLEARGLRSLVSSRQGRHRPHVTLAVADRMTAPQADTATMPLRDANDLALQLGSVAVFPGRTGVLYLSAGPRLRRSSRPATLRPDVRSRASCSPTKAKRSTRTTRASSSWCRRRPTPGAGCCAASGHENSS